MRIALGVVAIAVSAFSLGYSLAMFLISENRIRGLAEHRAAQMMKRMCRGCKDQRNNEIARERTEMMNAPMDK